MAIALANPHSFSAGGHTKIILSFGGADSFQFICWLRLALYKAKTYSESDNIYLDTYGLLDVSGTVLKLKISDASGKMAKDPILELSLANKLSKFTAEKKEDIEQQKNALLNARGGSVGSMNNAWNERYLKAMGEAHTMIFVITPAWLDSAFCGKEFKQFVSLQTTRHGEATPRGLYLTFDDDPTSNAKFVRAVGRNIDRLRHVPCKREWAVAGAVRQTLSPTMRDLFTLDQPSLLRLEAQIPN
ncbi:MAG TPA: hypothetical protein VH020_05550 [Stellaceae bacterium]|jgi:hypothetical protein|nr:hypothetical protein [Stellaceae bacterium]